MYVLELFHEGARQNGAGRLCFADADGALPAWTLLPAGPDSTEVLELAALALGGPTFVGRLPCRLDEWRHSAAEALRVEALIAPHSPRDERYDPLPRRGMAIEIGKAGAAAVVPGKWKGLPRAARPARPLLGKANQPWFFLAYGPKQRVHCGTDRFDFSDPFFRVSRFRSLFDPKAQLTDPVAFLSLLRYRGTIRRRYPAERALARLAGAFGGLLEIDVGEWHSKGCDFERVWADLPAWKRSTMAPLLDAARHMLDASPFFPEALDITCPILLNRPDELFPPEAASLWIRLFARLFPGAQAIAAVGEASRRDFPQELRARRHGVRPWSGEPSALRRRPAKLHAGAIALLHVDGRLPNLALMKLSRHFKEQGREVALARGFEKLSGVEAAYASAVFADTTSASRLAKLRGWYGSGLIAGGTGVDVALRLPPEIEALPPDYSLYPELEDRAIGFLTRGCPFDCPFCIVPVKEGRPRQVSDLETLLQGRKKLILLDDNILSHPKAGALLEEMAQREVEVNFTQTLDLHLVTRTKAELLRRVRCSNLRFTRRVYHFSLNNAEDLENVKRRYDLFRFTPAENVEFVCMYGYDTTLAQDVARFRFLRSLPGAYVFVQRYRPVPWEAAPDVPDFFGPDPDRLIHELVSICYKQNMKSMENYYRWLSRRYALAYGKLNDELVDYIFRYNRRSRRGLYVATLAGTLGADGGRAG